MLLWAMMFTFLFAFAEKPNINRTWEIEWRFLTDDIVDSFEVVGVLIFFVECGVKERTGGAVEVEGLFHILEE